MAIEIGRHYCIQSIGGTIYQVFLPEFPDISLKFQPTHFECYLNLINRNILVQYLDVREECVCTYNSHDPLWPHLSHFCVDNLIEMRT